MTLYLRRENARRDMIEAAERESSSVPVEKEAYIEVSVDSDMTDKQDLKFRYTL